MPSIRIDGLAREIETAPGASVGQVFEQAREIVWDQRRIIAEVRINGQTAVWSDGNAIWDTEYTSDSQLDLDTDVALRLTTSLLAQISGESTAFAEAHRSAAAQLRQGNQNAGIEVITTLMATWNDITHGIEQILTLHEIDLGKPEWKDVETLVLTSNQALYKQLQELREAAETKDLVLTADLLEYELAPQAEEWGKVCDQLSVILQSRFSTEGA